MLDIFAGTIGIVLAWGTAIMIVALVAIVLVLKEAHQYLHRYIPTEEVKHKDK